MKVIILAGGKGERLLSLTTATPKPLIKINNKPLIEYGIDLFKKYGFTDFIFTLCYLPDVIKKYFGTGKRFGIHIKYFVENPEKPLGTAGALAKLKNELKDTFIVCSGDIIRSCDIADIIKFHKEKKSIATICVYKNNRINPKSFITFAKDGKISNFVERPQTLPKGVIWSNASLYVFEPEVLSYIQENTSSDFGKDIFPTLLKHNKKIFAYKVKGYFLDVGTKEKIEIAEKDIKNNKL